MSKLTKLPALNTAPPSMPKPPADLAYQPPEGHGRATGEHSGVLKNATGAARSEESDEYPFEPEVQTPAASQVRQRRDPAEHVIEKLRKCNTGDIEDLALLLVRDHTALASLLFNSLGAADARRQQELIQAQRTQGTPRGS